jgi:hypothetical protein
MVLPDPPADLNPSDIVATRSAAALRIGRKLSLREAWHATT